MKQESYLNSHKYAVCAPEDAPIKDFYKGIYDEVFVFFHPFIKPISISYDLFEPGTYPGKNDIIEKCEMITWKQFLSLSETESYNKLDIGLRTRIMGLKKQFANEETSKRIQDTCGKLQLIEPMEGLFPEFLMNKVLLSIKQEGHDCHFSILCSEKNTINKIVEFADLEGFFCNDKTEIYWSLQNTSLS